MGKIIWRIEITGMTPEGIHFHKQPEDSSSKPDTNSEHCQLLQNTGIQDGGQRG